MTNSSSPGDVPTGRPGPQGQGGRQRRPELSDALRDYADGYEVDRARVLTRLSAGGAGREAGAAGTRSLLTRTGPLLSAAAVASVLLGVAVALHVTPNPDPSASPTPTRPQVTSSTVEVTASATATGSTSPRPSSASHSPVRSTAASSAPATQGGPTGGVTGAPTQPTGRPTPGTSTATPGARPTGGGATPSRPQGGQVGPAPTFVIAGVPGRLVLEPETGVDWVVVGSRRDGKQVRAKHGSGAVSVQDRTGDARAVTGPISIDWSGGAPEQDRSGDSTWWCAPSLGGDRASFSLRVSSLPASASLTLILGQGPNDASSARVKVEARVDGGALGQLRTSSAQVRVNAPAGSQGKGMSLEITPEGGGACLAVAVLR